MDRSKARWRFHPVSDDYGVKVSLVHPDATYVTEPPATAILGTDWPAERIALALTSLEEVYIALPDPEPSE